MRKKFWVFLGVGLFVLVPLTAQQGKILQPKRSLTVFDSKGRTIGAVLDTHFAFLYSSGQFDWPTVAFEWGQQTIVVGVGPGRFLGNSNFMAFASSDCSGTPYLSAPPSGPSLFSQSFVHTDGTLYATRAGTPTSTLNVGSLIESLSFPPYATDCNPGNYGEYTRLVEAEAVINMNSIYQPPFLLK